MNNVSIVLERRVILLCMYNCVHTTALKHVTFDPVITGWAEHVNYVCVYVMLRADQSSQSNATTAILCVIDRIRSTVTTIRELRDFA